MLFRSSRVMETHVLKEVRSKNGTVIEKTEPVYKQLDVKDEYVAAVKEGMRRVVYESGGTAVSVFKDIDPSITLGGKTGTAQTKPGQIEKNTGWFVAFTPYEEPEIAIAVVVPNGKTSGNAAPIGRRIIEEYYKLMKSEPSNLLPEYNQMVQ